MDEIIKKLDKIQKDILNFTPNSFGVNARCEMAVVIKEIIKDLEKQK
jgi:hypothetical protein